MRPAYAHEAVVVMDEGADEQALGGAITIALCGHWTHEPPCPLAPHHTAARREGNVVRLRVLFAAEPHDVREVRSRIDAALAGAEVATAKGTTRWRLRSTAPGTVQPDEAGQAERLVHS